MKIDLAVLEDALEEIIDAHKRVLFRVPPVSIVRLNVTLLENLLKDGKGAYITCHRCHIYVSRLLRKKGYPMDRITFIDPLYRISGDVRKPDECAKLIVTPFSRHFFPELKNTLEEVDFDFAIMDCITSLLNFQDEATVFSGLKEHLDPVLGGALFITSAEKGKSFSGPPDFWDQEVEIRRYEAGEG